MLKLPGFCIELGIGLMLLGIVIRVSAILTLRKAFTLNVQVTSRQKLITLGLAASFGAFLLAGGTKGKRIALPNAEIMIHQPAIHGNGVNGQVTDIKIVSDQLQKSKQRLNRILAENTGKTIEEIRRDTERDNFMTAAEALQYGLIDQVIEKR